MDISHSDFDDSIESVNKILLEIKSNDKPTIMVFNKIDTCKYEPIETDDISVEKTTKNHSIDDWKQTWMHKTGAENTLFISATEKDNFEEMRAKVYEKVRDTHVTRFPYNKFLYPDYEDVTEE